MDPVTIQMMTILRIEHEEVTYLLYKEELAGGRGIYPPKRDNHFKPFNRIFNLLRREQRSEFTQRCECTQ